VEDMYILAVPAILGDSDGEHRRKHSFPVVDIDGQVEGEVDVPDRAVVFGGALIKLVTPRRIVILENTPIEMVWFGDRGGEREDWLIRFGCRGRIPLSSPFVPPPAPALEQPAIAVIAPAPASAPASWRNDRRPRVLFECCASVEVLLEFMIGMNEID
jgi:hypothetical protein